MAQIPLECSKCGDSDSQSQRRANTWLRECLPGHHQGATALSRVQRDESRLPVLPARRPRTLAQPSSPQPSNAVQSNQRTASQTPSAFFSRLPPELRSHIYTLLFGNRTVHIEHQYGYPAVRGLKHDREGLSADRGRSKPKAWRWWHCVCHRQPRENLWNDSCRAGCGTWCGAQEKERRECEVDVAFHSLRKEEEVGIGYGWKGLVRSVDEGSRYCIQEYPDDTVIYCTMGTGGIS